MKNHKIILLHGWGGSKSSLTELAEKLKLQGYETLIPEMPGHGSTAQMQKPWDMNDFTDWLVHQIKINNINNYTLIGHSFGGKIILNSLIQNKINPHKVFLINTSGVKPKNSAKKLFWKNISKVSKPLTSIPGMNKIKNLTYKYIIGERDYINTSSTLKETFKIINEEFFDNKVSKINLETHLIWGKDDTSTPLWMGQFLKNNIPNSTLDILEGTHGLPLKNPEKVSEIIVKYL